GRVALQARARQTPSTVPFGRVALQARARQAHNTLTFQQLRRTLRVLRRDDSGARRAAQAGTMASRLAMCVKLLRLKHSAAATDWQLRQAVIWAHFRTM
ncbi:MAG: hypothetical protein JXR94_12500, partial [Candidatus Hydrogenedentes bacterium]|nr:hypothetical protein [Candidatus Hydrogenedentota bacterium]